MAARNKPAGIRSLVYGIGKGKDGIEGFERVAANTRPKTRAFLAASLRSLSDSVVDPHGLVADL